MSINLVETITSALSGPLMSQLTAAVGGEAGATSRGMAGAVPAILAGLLNGASTTAGTSNLVNTLANGNHEGLLGDLGSLLSGGSTTQELLKRGTALLPTLFGERGGAVEALISSVSGLSKGSAANLLGMLAPVALGFVTKHLQGAGGVNAASLTSLLSSQKSAIAAAAPAGLGAALGMANLNDEHGAGAVVAAPAKLNDGGMKWILALLAIVGLFFGVRSCERSQTEFAEPPAAAVAPAAASAPATTPAPVAAAPTPAPAEAAPADGLTEFPLPDDTTIRTTADGVEGKLLAFIKDAAKPVDITTWFNMNGLEFVTGSAELAEKSNLQLDAVAAILKAFPAVQLKVGGYTDNVGNVAANLKLSGDRAAATVAALVQRGVNKSRLEGEGYGDQHSVADNATAEGRQRNRRIDVRITAK